MWLRKSFLIVVLSLIVAAGGSSHARDVVATNFNAPSVDLSGVTEILRSTEREISIPVPGGEGGQETAMTITAKGPGAVHHYAAFTLFNEEPMPRDFVLIARWPGYVGSGLFWPDFGGMQVLNIQASPGLQPQRVEQTHADVFSLRLNPGETVTYVAELTGDQLANLSLWQRAAYDKQQQQLSFFRGVVLGIATLTAVFMLCLFIIRLQSAFPAAALFAFASVAFIALEFGYLPVLSSILPDVAGLEVRIRAVVEALMAAGAIGCLLTFLDLRRRAPQIGYPILGAFIATLVLAVAAWFMPSVGMGLARLLLLVTAIGGFGLIIAFWRQGVIRAQASLVMWCFLLLWTLCSIAAAMGWIDIEVVGPILAWGLVLVLLTMAFTLTQFAFNQGVINSRFFEDSGRRGLALAGAEQVVWDWNEERGSLFVGPELERILGHQQGRISRGGLKGWLELIHPSDRTAYVDIVESAVQRGRGTFSQEFRLRRGDGTYRWFLLRARSLAGDLGRAVRCIGTLTDVTATKRSEEQLLVDAVRDRITGLPNPALFIDRIEQALRRAEMTRNDSIFVLIIDLDRFKHVNDSLGFAVGDSLLLTVARRLSTVMGPDDTLARLHGDRFGIIFNARQPHRQVGPFLDHLRKLIARPVPLKPQEIFLTACIGVAQYKLDNIRPEQLMKDAEIALYEAKRQGKDSLVTFKSSMREGPTALPRLESELHTALERNQIEVVYQPVMRLNDRELAGFEALVRWRHELHGLLEPDAFMNLAEELGLMNELGRFVLTQAARQLGIWQRAYRSEEPLFMTVNVSSRELINRDLVDEVRTVLQREDLVPGTLKLELTETVLMENPELSIRVLHQLQHAGVGIACDDFGTGYSALSHLRRLPFDTIKIDRSFLENEADDEAAQIILEAIILLAHDLGMDTVAEGIESMDQADRLRELGCDYGQGYLFGEPMSARQVMEAFGGSQSIASRGARGEIRSASFWQRLIRRGEEAGQQISSRREGAPVAGPAEVASAAHGSQARMARPDVQAEAQSLVEAAELPARSAATDAPVETDSGDAKQAPIATGDAGTPVSASVAPPEPMRRALPPQKEGGRPVDLPTRAEQKTAPQARPPQTMAGQKVGTAAEKPGFARTVGVSGEKTVAGQMAAKPLAGRPSLPPPVRDAAAGPATVRTPRPATPTSGVRSGLAVTGGKPGVVQREPLPAAPAAPSRLVAGESGPQAPKPAALAAPKAASTVDRDSASRTASRTGFTVGLWVNSDQDVPVPVETTALDVIARGGDEMRADGALPGSASPTDTIFASEAAADAAAGMPISPDTETAQQDEPQAELSAEPKKPAEGPELGDSMPAEQGDEVRPSDDEVVAPSAETAPSIDKGSKQQISSSDIAAPDRAASHIAAPDPAGPQEKDLPLEPVSEVPSSGEAKPDAVTAVAVQVTGEPTPSQAEVSEPTQVVQDQFSTPPSEFAADADNTAPAAGLGARPIETAGTNRPGSAPESDDAVKAVAATIAATIKERAEQEVAAKANNPEGGEEIAGEALMPEGATVATPPSEGQQKDADPVSQPGEIVGEPKFADLPGAPDVEMENGAAANSATEVSGTEAEYPGQANHSQAEQPRAEQPQAKHAQPDEAHAEQTQPEQAQPEETQPEQAQPEQPQPEQPHHKKSRLGQPAVPIVQPMHVAVVGDAVGTFKAVAKAEAVRERASPPDADPVNSPANCDEMPAVSTVSPRRVTPPPPPVPDQAGAIQPAPSRSSVPPQAVPRPSGPAHGGPKIAENVRPAQTRPTEPRPAQREALTPQHNLPGRLPPTPVAAGVADRRSGTIVPPPPPAAPISGAQERPRPPLRRLLKRQRPPSNTDG